jgi:hypothetical protein
VKATIHVRMLVAMKAYGGSGGTLPSYSTSGLPLSLFVVY